MDRLSIYLAEGNYDGSVIMSSDSSKVIAVRVKKRDAQQYVELDQAGIYFLLVGNNAVYVDQSGLDTVKKRIMNTHSRNIDSSWHTVLALMFTGGYIGTNELLFMENAMCEYAHAHYAKCLTTTPAKTNCNVSYRKQHYHLGSGQIHSCNQYVSDMEYYISLFTSIFPSSILTASAQSATDTELFYFRSPKRDADGKAEIGIHLGHKKSRQAVLKAGSKVSKEVSSSFGSSQSVIVYRKQLENAGILIDCVLQQDIPFDSQSGAGQFLNVTSFDGNSNWKTISDNTPLKDLLE